MAFNTKNEDALIYGIDRNSYGGYIDGVAVEVSVYPTNNQQLVSDLTKNTQQPNELLVANQISNSQHPGTDVLLPTTYHGARIGGDVSSASVCNNGAVDLNEEHKSVEHNLHQYIKDESEDSQCATLTPVPEIQIGNKSLAHYTNQTPYQPYSGLNLLQPDSAQYQVNPSLLFYSNASHQKQFYGALERKVFGEDHLLNYKDRLSGSLNSSPYFDGKLSWFANSLQSHAIGHQMESDAKITENSFTRQLNENPSEIVGINLEVAKEKKKKVRHEKNELAGQNEEEVGGKFECAHCSYRGQSAAILKIHQRTHSGERPFQCHLCDYRAGQKHNVTKHILVHMNEKPYKCQFCEYRCAQKNNLIVHERTHTGIKPFACTFCEYKTVQKPNLVKHMYLHTNEKPFACEYCDYRCVQKTNLKKHVQKHVNHMNDSTKRREISPSKLFSCSLCPYKCAYRLGLVKHEQTKHTIALAKLNNMSENNSIVQNCTVDASVPMKPISEDVRGGNSPVCIGKVSPINQFKEES